MSTVFCRRPTPSALDLSYGPGRIKPPPRGFCGGEPWPINDFDSLNARIAEVLVQ
jgi:hypothetical protein